MYTISIAVIRFRKRFWLLYTKINLCFFFRYLALCVLLLSQRLLYLELARAPLGLELLTKDTSFITVEAQSAWTKTPNPI